MTKSVIEVIKEKRHDAIIVCGGLHPSVFAEYILKPSPVDYILRGDGERSFLQFLNACEEGRGFEKVDGISYLEEGKIINTPEAAQLTLEELSNLPIPDFSQLTYNNAYFQIPVESSRGCSCCCCFCSIPHRHNWRGLSPEVVVERVKKSLVNEERFAFPENILFVDDCFTINTERAVSIFEKLSKEISKEKKYFIEVRIANIIKGGLLDKIDSDMLFGLQIGVECGYDEGLKNVHKNLTIAQLYQGLEILKENNFHEKAMLSFIIGFPWETEKEIIKTLKTIEDIAAKYKAHCNLNWLFYLPSQLWKEREKYGINIDESMFDNICWTSNVEIFFKTHPNINYNIISNVGKWYVNAREKGLNVTYTTPLI